MRAHCRRPIPYQARQVVRAEGGGVIRDDRGVHAQAALDEVVVHCTHRQHCRDRGGLCVEAIATVRQHQHLCALLHGLRRCCAQLFQCRLESARLASRYKARGKRHCLKSLIACDGIQVVIQEHGRREDHLRERVRARHENVTACAKVHVQAHHQPFAKRIDGWVRNLRKTLLEVVVQHVRGGSEHRKGGVVTHAVCGLNASSGHALNHQLHILSRVSVCGLHLQSILC
mmetsp:Transcript_21023/g.39973  ORF Transcript_21023/g.39973 Transcript_21023/m.39973 type:complete len:229 (-) Transcript_21023:1832-2518(-)